MFHVKHQMFLYDLRHMAESNSSFYLKIYLENTDKESAGENSKNDSGRNNKRKDIRRKGIRKKI